MRSPHTSGCYDVAFIGGGHNSLVAAAYCAGAGLKVVVLEKNAVTGGAALTEEFAPGFSNSVAAYTVSLLSPKVIADLELARHGLTIVERPCPNFWPINGTGGLLLPYDLEGRQRAIAEFSSRDAARLPEFEAMLARAADAVRVLADQIPPNAGGGLMDVLRAGLAGRRLAQHPIEDQRDLLDLFTMSATDFLGRWFESDVVKGAFAFDSIVGAYAPPSWPGSAYVLLHHAFGAVNGRKGVWGHAVGGMGAVAQSIARAAAARGAKLRTNAAVRRVIIENGRACGVALESGEVIGARAVAAGVAPKLLFGRLVPDGALPAALAARFTGMKSGSGTFRLNVALGELPQFACRPATGVEPHHGAGIIIGPSLSYLERAFEDARDHGWSAQPVIEMVIPSVLDPALAPAGKHVASLFVQFVAPELPAPRTWVDPAETARFADLVIATVAKAAPNFAAAVLARQVLSPRDLEERFGLPDGDIFHGQLTLNQLFSARPVLGYADHRMPLPGLYLCGSGAHPGGGVTGLPGRNGARAIIRDLQSFWRWT